MDSTQKITKQHMECLFGHHIWKFGNVDSIPLRICKCCHLVQRRTFWNEWCNVEFTLSDPPLEHHHGGGGGRRKLARKM